MQIKKTIEQKLISAFSPESLEVIDESEQHRGHGGWRPGGETHFRIRMHASVLEGKSRIERQRAINKVLSAEIAGHIHALAMEINIPRT